MHVPYMTWANLISRSIHVLAAEEAKLEFLDAIGLLSNSAHRNCMSASPHLEGVGNIAAFFPIAQIAIRVSAASYR